ncbi:MAG TPA: glycosyltransferase, partial [Longimicrobiaceae bacterium]|nr:glycosyltransferase [Longimicrobiaceae bacterium]
MVVASWPGRAMRIVLSNTASRWGATQALTEALARGLQARGHAVAVLCRPRSALEERLRGVVPCEPVLTSPELSPAAIWRCSRALRRHRPEVVLTLTDGDVRVAALVARIHGVPVVVCRTGVRTPRPRPHFRLLYGTLPAHHVAASESLRRAVLRSAPWLKPAEVTVLPPGVDAAAYDAARPAALGLPEGALAVGFVGRLEDRTGIVELGRAWPAVAAALPAAHLLVAGLGPAEGDARAVLTAEPRVHWLGFRDDVPALLKALDLVALPAHGDGTGLVAVEALAAGAAVVAADAGVLAERVRDGVDGVLVPARDPAALARALVALGHDPAR